MLLKGTITVPNTVARYSDPNNQEKKVIFRNCAPFTNFTSEINNTEIDSTKNIDVVMPMYKYKI